MSESLRSSEAFARYNESGRVGRPCPDDCECGRHDSEKPEGFQVGRIVTKQTREKISNALIGRPLTEERKESIAAGMVRARKRGCLRHYYLTGSEHVRTSLEQILAELLESFQITYEEQVQFGRYVADFYAPSLNTIYEADGLYWHQDAEREAKRDAYLKDRFGVEDVLHFTERELLDTPAGTGNAVGVG